MYVCFGGGGGGGGEEDLDNFSLKSNRVAQFSIPCKG